MREALSKVSDTVFTWCFNHLAHTNSVAVQYAAAQCLAALSVGSLPKVVTLFMQKAESVKNNDADSRLYTSYQRAVQYFDFSFATPRDVDATVDYLISLLALMKRSERGVLRAEICGSVRTILRRLLDRRNEKRWYEFQAFQKRNVKVDVLWSVYRQIYELVGKWAKKSKHTLFCHHTMYCMVLLGSEAFYLSGDREDIFQLLIAGMGKSSTKAEYFEFVRSYIKELPSDFINLNFDAFTTQMTYLVSHLFPKAKVKSLPL